MGSTAESIRAGRNYAARAFTVGVLACCLAVMPALAQSPQADFEAGKSYHDGDGVPQNYRRARRLYKRAADDGNTDAMINLGYMYYVGQGVAQDYDKARDWYIRADRLGSVGARDNLQGLYSRGLSSPPALTEINPPLKIVSEEVPSAEVGLEAPILNPTSELETESEPELSDVTSSAPSAIDPDEVLTSITADVPVSLPDETGPDETGPDETGPDETGPEIRFETEPTSEIHEPETPDILPEIPDTAQPAFQTPASKPPASDKAAFNIVQLIPYLIGALVLLVLLGIIGLIRFITRAQRRFVESFTQAHDYGLRRMYSNFLQTARSEINHDIWMRGVSDMMVRYAHEEDVIAAHAQQVRPLQEAAKDGPQAARLASQSLTLRAEALIVKSYSRLGAPD